MSASRSAPELAQQLLEWFRPVSSCAVALSGGVDSGVVAAAAYRAVGDRAVAVTGQSASLAAGELEQAQEVARQIGIRHLIIETREFENPRYLQNAPDRCYHCKTELYDRMDQWLQQVDADIILNGANVDDLGDYRPGLQAAREHAVRSPLAECGFTKRDVRAVAEYWQLPVWDKPAAPCLSSRIAYGEEVTPQRLTMIDQAEQFLKGIGFAIVRVRYHRGDLARIEVPAADVGRLLQSPLREQLADYFTQLGFKFVTVDLNGFRSGSLNVLVEKIEANFSRGSA